MQLSKNLSPSDFRLVATVCVLLSVGMTVAAWLMFASGGYKLGSCEQQRRQLLCEIGRTMLAAFPAEYRHLLFGAALLGVAALFAWGAIQGVRRSEEMVRSGLDNGKGLM